MKNVVELGSLAETITKGTTPTTLGKPFTEEGVPFLRVQNVKDGKVLINSDILYIGESTHATELKRSRIYNNDLLLTIAGTIGRTAIVQNINQELNCNQAVAIIRLGSSNLDVNYLKWFIQSDEAVKQFNKGKVTATISNLSLGQVSKLKVPLPSLASQKKIAAILDAADQLRQKDKALIEKYDRLTQALFLDMFGDPVTNPKGWEMKDLKDVTTKIGSGATPRGGKEAYKTSGISLIRSLNVHDSKFLMKDLAYIDDDQAKKLDNVRVEEEDVLFNITGASVCRCSLVPANILPARVNQHVAIIRTKRSLVNSTFLSNLLVSVNTKKQLMEIATQGGATREAITKEQLNNYKVICPSVLPQNQFAERVQAIEQQKQLVQQNLQKSEELFNSLLQKAFIGELV